ncbi:MAG: sigma-70 family RNA polymerase sigma factor [Burkholderiales bacterium]|nr:sigma-70 family RNA polymerase sigma factor [Burkholderiales bacterium]
MPLNSDAATRPDASAHADELAEIQLLRRIGEGELRAFDALYRQYYPRLSRFLGRVTRRTPLVEEILNDTMMVVWRRAASFNGQSKVSTWIFAIAYRKALKALKGLDEPVEDLADDRQEAATPGPEQAADQRQTFALLARAIGSLSVDHRAVVELTYFHGFGYREIAEILACPIDTVKTRMFHAKRKLKGLLAYGLEDE